MDLEQLYLYLPDAIYIVDPETASIVGANRAAYDSLGLTLEELLTKKVYDLQADLSGLEHWSRLADVIRQQPSYLFIGHHRCADGRLLPVEVKTHVHWHEDREVFVSVVRDISSRMEHLCKSCGDSRDGWLGLHDAADGCWDWHPQTGALYFSPSLKRLLGYGPDEMKPCLSTWEDNIHPEDAPLVLSVLDEHLRGQRHLYEAEYRLRNRNGHYIWVRDSGQVRERDARGKPCRVVGLVHNITDLKQQEINLQHQAEIDALTGLFNRRRGEVLAEQMIALMQRQRRPLGFALLDVDDFKQINDVHGHLAGDEVLRRLAGYIDGFIRHSDLLYRWGGEEFVLLCPDTSKEGMQVLMQKMLRGVACLDWQELFPAGRVTISIGVSLYPDNAPDLNNLMARADSALYAAKRRGKDRVEFSSNVSAPVGGAPQADRAVLGG